MKRWLRWLLPPREPAPGVRTSSQDEPAPPVPEPTRAAIATQAPSASSDAVMAIRPRRKHGPAKRTHRTKRGR